MKRRDILLVFITILAMVLFSWKKSRDALFLGARAGVKSVAIFNHADRASRDFSTASSDATPGPVSDQVDLIHQLFSQNLRALGACLQIQNQVTEDAIEPTLDNLLRSVREPMGEIVNQYQDWSETDLQFSDGFKRRVRTEMNNDDPAFPVTYLQVYKLLPDPQFGDAGIPEMEDIDPQQAVNPSEDYIQSLSTGGQVTNNKRGLRAFFNEGEEMTMVISQNQLEYFLITKDGRTFNCNLLNQLTAHCSCY